VTVAIDLPKLYRRAINIWVEDALTSEYLRDVWGNPNVLCLISGSTDSIAPAVRDAERNGLRNVFGIADQDFNETNYTRWGNAGLKFFVLPVHEVENYLLDPAALAGSDANNNGRAEADIEARMLERAAELVWWMACRRTIKRLRNLCWDDFVPVPKPTAVTDLRSALDHILNSQWYGTFPGHAAQITQPALVEAWITEAGTGYAADLSNGNWKRTFAGKELLHTARGFIYQPPKPAPPSVYDVDVAKSVAKWQMDNGRVPSELNELHVAMQSKIWGTLR
jgi:hypothetical protein